VLVRTDAIAVLALGPEGLRAECGIWLAVRLTATPCSAALILGLVAAIERASRRRSHISAGTGSVPRIVLRADVFQANRPNRRYLRDVFPGLCPVVTGQVPGMVV
jgi:hypothetical protein